MNDSKKTGRAKPNNANPRSSRDRSKRRRGAQYEEFVSEKFRRLFPDAEVIRNRRIRGRESEIEREVDVSVQLTVGDTELLYIVQCKDWNVRADIKVLGEFASVIQDVGAAKGFLFCSAGFAKSNHVYARKKGIELITIEDINSERWNVDVQVPLIYVRKRGRFSTLLDALVNEELAAKNRNQELVIEKPTSNTALSVDGGASVTSFEQVVKEHLDRVSPTVPYNIRGLHVRIADVWLPCSLTLSNLGELRTHYLKYLKPTEYSHLKDHVRGTTLPLHVVLEQIGLRLDDTFIELPEGPPPVFPGLWLEVAEQEIRFGDTANQLAIQGSSFSIRRPRSTSTGT